MFFKRLLSSLLLIPLVLLLLFYAPSGLLFVVLLFLLLICGQEYIHLIPLETNIYKLAYYVLLILSTWIATIYFSLYLHINLFLWVLLIGAILSYPRKNEYWANIPVIAITGLIILPVFIIGMVNIYQLPNGKLMLLYSFVLIWAADIGAYLVGKCWGKHKLIPLVSPGKSWEGLLGGCLFSSLIAILAFFFFHPASFYKWYLLAFLTVIISIFGDLLMSMLKRRCHLKDTGGIIPGHGGILDRVDSLIAAIPFFYFGLIGG